VFGVEMQPLTLLWVRVVVAVPAYLDGGPRVSHLTMTATEANRCGHRQGKAAQRPSAALPARMQNLQLAAIPLSPAPAGSPPSVPKLVSDPSCSI